MRSLVIPRTVKHARLVKLNWKQVWITDTSDGNPGEWWTVVRHIQPNKFDDFLLLTRKSTSTIHPDNIVPIFYQMLDCHNDEFVTDTPAHRARITAYCKRDAAHRRDANRFNKFVSDCWLAPLKDDND